MGYCIAVFTRHYTSGLVGHNTTPAAMKSQPGLWWAGVKPKNPVPKNSQIFLDRLFEIGYILI